MISKIRLKNARIFGNQDYEFTFPTLSVLCGTNSSGKSTILKSLLLLRQTQGILESSDVPHGQLRFIGSQVDLGNYRTFVHRRKSQKDIEISVVVENSVSLESLETLLDLSDQDELDSLRKYADDEDLPYELEVHLTFSCRDGIKNIGESSRNLNSQQDASEKGQSDRTGLLKTGKYTLTAGGLDLLNWEVHVTGFDEDNDPVYEILIPERYFRAVTNPELFTLEQSEQEGYLKATTVLDGILPGPMISQIVLGTTEENAVDSIDATEPEWGVFPLPPHIEGPQRDFKNNLRRIHYLGPLRTPSKRYYITHFDSYPRLDPTGEFLPFILRDEGETQVANVRPNTKDVILESLADALDSWLYYMRVGSTAEPQEDNGELDVTSLKEVIVEIEVRSVIGEKTYALADSGFGYSQVLPILVRGLLAGRSSTLIVEQPELHLNPSLQVRLAEFFVAMSLAGKQIILETHSEHIVNAIRVLAAEDESGLLSDSTCVFFLDVDLGVPVIHELSVQQDGTIPEWPLNFFGEAASLTGRLLRAQKQFRKKRK